MGGVKESSLVSALEVTEALASEIGPRRPCSDAEEQAAELMEEWLTGLGLEVRTEGVPSQPTFALPYALLFGMALGAGALPRRRRALRAALATSSAVMAALEARFHPASPVRLLERWESSNVVGTLEPEGAAERTLCLVSHLDSSRSGLMFHPRITPHLPLFAGVVGGALAAQGLEPVLGRWRVGRTVLRSARAVVALGAALIAERELRGVDVPGANDNASGVGACVALAAEIASRPLRSTRLVVLVTGSEESGVLGARSFLERHDTTGWLFLNFDGVGAPAALHYLRREGGTLQSYPADAGLMAVAEGVAQAHPELGLSGTDRSSGLPYDATPVLAAGGRAITLTVQNGSIPNYHWPTDTVDRIDPEVLGRALGAGREMIAAIDRGEADI